MLQRQRTLGPLVASIAEAATVSVPGSDAAAIAISLSGRPSTAAITARVALELDMMQYDTHDGPCLTSFRTMSMVRIDLIEEGDRFPHFALGARRKGVRGVLSVPALWGPELVATLNLYSPFDEAAASVAEVLAAQAASQSVAPRSSSPPAAWSRRPSATSRTTPTSSSPADSS